MRHLAHRNLGFAYCRGDFGVVEAEHFAHHEHGTLVRGQGFQHHEHGHGDRFGQHHIGRGVPVVVVVGHPYRLGQPRPHILLATTAVGAQGIQGLAADNLCQIGFGVGHGVQLHLRPPQIALLQYIIGFRCGTEHFVCDGEQQRAQVGEQRGMIGAGHRYTCALSASARLPPCGQ